MNNQSDNIATQIGRLVMANCGLAAQAEELEQRIKYLQQQVDALTLKDNLNIDPPVNPPA